MLTAVYKSDNNVQIYPLLEHDRLSAQQVDCTFGHTLTGQVRKLPTKFAVPLNAMELDNSRQWEREVHRLVESCNR